MLPESPLPVALFAIVLGLTVAQRFGNGLETGAASGGSTAYTLLPATATAGVAIMIWTTPVSVWLWPVVAVLGLTAPLASLAEGSQVAWRRPTPAEEPVLAAVPERSAVDIRVVAANGRIDGYAVSPLSGAVGVSEAALARLSQSEIAALVAHERAHHEGYHVFLRAAASICWLTLGGLVVATTFPGSMVTAAAVLAFLAGERVVAVLVARHTEYAADARAVELTSCAAVSSLLGTLATVERRPRSRLWGLASAHPSYRRRLARIEA